MFRALPSSFFKLPVDKRVFSHPGKLHIGYNKQYTGKNQEKTKNRSTSCPGHLKAGKFQNINMLGEKTKCLTAQRLPLYEKFLELRFLEIGS
jgi:hypothetical protein